MNSLYPSFSLSHSGIFKYISLYEMVCIYSTQSDHLQWNLKHFIKKPLLYSVRLDRYSFFKVKIQATELKGTYIWIDHIDSCHYSVLKLDYRQSHLQNPLAAANIPTMEINNILGKIRKINFINVVWNYSRQAIFDYQWTYCCV